MAAARRRKRFATRSTFPSQNVTLRMPMDTMSDEALLEGIAYGNESALALLYQHCEGLAHSLAVRMVGDLHGAEDVVQESFLNLWRMANSLNIRRKVLRRGCCRSCITRPSHPSGNIRTEAGALGDGKRPDTNRYGKVKGPADRSTAGRLVK